MTGDFSLVLVSNEVYYPVKLTQEQQDKIEFALTSMSGKIGVINKPIGIVGGAVNAKVN